MPFKPLTGSSDEQKWGAATDMLRELFDLKVVQVFKDEAGTRRVILDKDGLRTSPPGVDVFTAGDDDLTFNSNQNVLKVVQSGTTTIPSATSSSDASSSSVTVQHDLGYVPICLAYAVVSTFGPTEYIALPTFLNIAGFQVVSTGGPTTNIMPLNEYVTVRTTSTQALFINSWANSNTPSSYTSDTVNIKYYLLQETAA